MTHHLNITALAVISACVLIWGLVSARLERWDVSAPIAFVLLGLGFANIFPLVFSIVIDKLPEHTNALSGLMVTACVGAALVPPVMGLVADAHKSVQLSFIVPLLCLAYITWTAVMNLRTARA